MLLAYLALAFRHIASWNPLMEKKRRSESPRNNSTVKDPHRNGDGRSVLELHSIQCFSIDDYTVRTKAIFNLFPRFRPVAAYQRLYAYLTGAVRNKPPLN